MMMKGGKSSVLTLAEKCKNILASNWRGDLHTIKVDSQGSKKEIYCSKVKYFAKKGKPYIWVPDKDLHNVNTIIDERGSFAVRSPCPGPIAHILNSIRKVPTGVVMAGGLVCLNDEKAKLATENLRDALLADQKTVKESSYSVSGLMNSSYLISTSRSAKLQELLQGDEQYTVYRLNLSLCAHVDCNGGDHEVKLEDFEMSKADPLSPFSMSLIDGINQSETRRRALVLFCITFLNENAKDAFVLSVDRKGFDVLGKVLGSVNNDGSCEYRWKELRFTLKEEARDVETFCKQLLEMEEEALTSISNRSGI